MRKIKLVYIAGSGRSGSTLLGHLIAEFRDSITVGELAFFWGVKNKSQQMCGCGKEIHLCKQWKLVLEKYFQARKPQDVPVPRNGALARGFSTYPILLGFGNYYIDDEYINILLNLYSGICETTGCETIVDESKTFPYLYALQKTGLFDVHVLHLVRDPRAVAFSWQRRKNWRRNEKILSSNPIHKTRPIHIAALQWLVHQLVWWVTKGNVSGEKYLLIRYENFVAAPHKLIKEISSKFELNGISPFISDTEFRLTQTHHSVFGNPTPPKTGINRIRKDVEWQKKMSSWAKLLVTLVCWPMMLMHGYPLIQYDD